MKSVRSYSMTADESQAWLSTGCFFLLINLFSMVGWQPEFIDRDFREPFETGFTVKEVYETVLDRIFFSGDHRS